MDLRYPIGKFKFDGPISEEQRIKRIQQIEELPLKLREAVAGLTEEQLDTPYRPDGWTVRQVVHHLADSHLNNYIRIRFALTEDKPTIMPYNQAHWAELFDARAANIDLSLALLTALHARWVMLIKSITSEDWNRTYLHPEMGTVTFDMNISLYAWHSRHHVAHITELRKRNGW
ncbi:bacillithiol transferase BstA [candidate division KSB1 bacterium]|nr:bacillithiol transferase BstA [candidate division KSB1 bacterium]